ncbi:SGNH/GDSL hydrolase family protein [Cryobacterium sinapicolor]|uniref:SGNH/GDSL hydrolase family protein n=1 Tax=Cryobacterium sinapicolor TaxID=1259236 RepID=A0ABY2JKR6_9MICO|nr:MULTISPECIES: SGNH/GDSL hydrolase family protein [Cryobacterium]TFC93732.1 SGNH/GDSL hydrolase family protein [Cryobacterium sp. TMT3-29-2]TFD05389.1 SGNH/GDSL hydrolase family protein [Cryobacterium sinapicolor]
MPTFPFTRLAAVPYAPLLVTQARRLRRETPRLPDAALPWTGSRPGPDPLRILVLGDSTAAGVGAETQAEALPGWIAHEVSERWGRGSTWRAIGENGATARDVRARFLTDAAAVPFDLALLTIGANDALGLRSRNAFTNDVRRIVLALRAAAPQAAVLVSLMPRFDRFALLPEPLRATLARHAASLDTGARLAVEGLDGVVAIPTPPPYVDGFFASDEFHPSALGYRLWAEFVFDSAPGLRLDRPAG